jgi:pimeloyl-ACP methyl ester carboxylesterase
LSSPGRVAGYGIDDVVDHYAWIVSASEPKPIVIGHSFGGLIAQRLLGQNLAAAAFAIDPAPIKGIVYVAERGGGGSRSPRGRYSQRCSRR